MQLRRSHTHQQRELGPRLKSAFLNTSFLFKHGLMASQSIGLHRHGKPLASPSIGSRFERGRQTEAAFAFMRVGVFGIGTSIHQVPFLHAHPNGR
jgi:hypothetical protein